MWALFQATQELLEATLPDIGLFKPEADAPPTMEHIKELEAAVKTRMEHLIVEFDSMRSEVLFGRPRPVVGEGYESSSLPADAPGADDSAKMRLVLEGTTMSTLSPMYCYVLMVWRSAAVVLGMSMESRLHPAPHKSFFKGACTFLLDTFGIPRVCSWSTWSSRVRRVYKLDVVIPAFKLTLAVGLAASFSLVPGLRDTFDYTFWGVATVGLRVSVVVGVVVEVNHPPPPAQTPAGCICGKVGQRRRGLPSHKPPSARDGRWRVVRVPVPHRIP